MPATSPAARPRRPSSSRQMKWSNAGRGAGDLQDVLVAAVAGGGEHADALALDVEAPTRSAIARTAVGLWP
jgi:hypothetical protein